MTVQPLPGLRQRKKDRLRAQLIETAVDLFLERGYAVTTIDDIVGAIDVSPRTFFRYFATKDDIVAAGPFQVGSGLKEFVESAPLDRPPLEIARDAMRLIATRFQQLPNCLELGRLILKTPDICKRLAFTREQWARDVAAGLMSRHLGPRAAFEALVIAGSVQLLLAAAFERWVGEDAARPLTDVLEEALEFADAAYHEPRRTGSVGETG